MKQGIESAIMKWDNIGHPIRTATRKNPPSKNEDSLRGLWDNIKYNDICNIEVSEGEEKEQEIKNLFQEIMTENFLNLEEEINIQAQKVQSPRKEAHTQTHHN